MLLPDKIELVLWFFVIVIAGLPAVMDAETDAGPPARAVVAVLVYTVPSTGVPVCLKSIQTVPACAPARAARLG
jgi:hypothetical protein